MATANARGGTRVVLVEDHAVFAESLEIALTLDGHDARRLTPDDFSSPPALLARLHRLQPRIVLLDLDLGALGDGARLISPLVEAGFQVVVLTSSEGRARWGSCLALGARRVLSKAGPLDDIRSTIRAIARGAAVMNEADRAELVDLAHRDRTDRAGIRARLSRLSPREGAVLGELIRGRTVREIAQDAVVSEATVRSQVKSILAKLEVSSQIAAVGLAHSVDWQPPTPP